MLDDFMLVTLKRAIFCLLDLLGEGTGLFKEAKLRDPVYLLTSA